MSISNFIPTVWSETLYKELDKHLIAVKHCNRDFEGEIKKKGSVVNICGIGNVNVKNYTKDTDLTAPETLSDTLTTLTIDQAKCFNFQLDDIDKIQASPKLMEAALEKAATAIANEADRYVFNLYHKDYSMVQNYIQDNKPMYETILEARTILYKNNVSEGTPLYLEVTPEVAEKILKERMNCPLVKEDFYETGYLGSILGCKIFVSNNIPKVVGAGVLYHNCILRTKRCITFADQLSEIEAYRPEKRFADAIKGLHLYGAKIIYPKEYVMVRVEIPDTTTT